MSKKVWIFQINNVTLHYFFKETYKDKVKLILF